MTYYDLTVSGLVFISAFTGSSLILMQGKEARNDRFLGAALLIISLTFSYYIFRSSGLLLQCPHLIRVVSPFMYLIAPFFFIYIRNLMQNRVGVIRFDFLHFLPATLHFIELIPFYLKSTEDKLIVAQSITEDFNQLFVNGSGLIPIQYHYILRTLQLLVYLGLLIAIVRTEKCKDEIQKNWAKVVFTAYILITILFSALFLLGLKKFDPNLQEFGYLFSINLYGFLVVSIFGYQIVKRPKSVEFVVELPQDQSEAVDDTNQQVDQYSGLLKKYSKDRLEEVYQRTFNHLSDPLFFRKPDLKISNLSDLIGFPSRGINTVLLHHCGKRFQDLLNKKRIDYVKELILKGTHKTQKMEALGEEAGFSSRASFFRAFKEYEQMTPKEFADRYSRSMDVD